MLYIADSVKKDAIRVAQTAHEQYLSALIWERVADKAGDFDAVESARAEQVAKKNYMEGAYAVLEALGVDWDSSEVAEILVTRLAELNK